MFVLEWEDVVGVCDQVINGVSTEALQISHFGLFWVRII
jgi:hypothetical protein